ncbi:hypothetical protein TREMEDRAFT_35940, partial [Tremella mesenterica DSM 1558]|uniref:uncharacterized protein n=1 Tax=Tremella mesenterica (strain ATCC 24925 / CBS 8224 / DSM 1558 / NBRC 9311 / NRRL Y-6157 / RJB 2259-6 / UBC 559-6) TaxID=578456 RepID=UPI00032C5868
SSLLLAFRLESRPVLLIGGGPVSHSRLIHLISCGSHITLISPTITSEISSLISSSNSSPFPSKITYLKRLYKGESDDIKVKDFSIVLTAIDDPIISKETYEMCKFHRVPINVADVPDLCDFYFGAQFKKGLIQVMVSTSGKGPRVGAMIRDIIEDCLPEELESSVEGVGILRKELREKVPGIGGDKSKKRMEWMKSICDAWGLDNLKLFKEEKIREWVFINGWEKDRVVRPDQIPWNEMPEEIRNQYRKGMKKDKRVGKLDVGGTEMFFGLLGWVLGTALGALFMLGLAMLISWYMSHKS